jgi:hypothetical protein
MQLAPICLFTYKRLQCTKQTIEALQKNFLASESRLFIFSDSAKKEADQAAVEEVRNYLETIKGFAEVNIIKREKNWGLANSIIDGVSNILAQYQRVIVLEDDLITAPNFLTYMNQALEFYESNKEVFSIAGYTSPLKFPSDYEYDVYFAPRASSWGWASWHDRWKDIDWQVKDFESFIKNSEQKKRFNQGGSDMVRMLSRQMRGEMDSWAIRWCYHQFKMQQMTVFPMRSKIQNIGFGDNATHTKFNRFATILDDSNQMNFKMPEEVIRHRQILKAFRATNSLLVRIIGRLKYYLGLK